MFIFNGLKEGATLWDIAMLSFWFIGLYELLMYVARRIFNARQNNDRPKALRHTRQNIVFRLFRPRLFSGLANRRRA